MAILNREQILGITDMDVLTLEIPEWGGEIKVRPMNGSERSRYESSIYSMTQGRSEALGAAKKWILSRVICDDDGKPLFNDRDANLLFDKSAKALSRIWEKVEELSGVKADDVADAEEN